VVDNYVRCDNERRIKIFLSALCLNEDRVNAGIAVQNQSKFLSAPYDGTATIRAA
jgi:hypothetical protein